jgi:hypothetical protein
MNVDGHVERFGRGEDLPEFFVVEVFALRVRVDDCAFQSQRAYAALELFGRRSRVLRRDGGEASVARRMCRDCRRELVVAGACQCGSHSRVEDLHARRRQRQDLQVYPGRVHVVDAPRP